MESLCHVIYCISRLQKKWVEILNEENSPFYLSYNLKLNDSYAFWGCGKRKKRALKKV